MTLAEAKQKLARFGQEHVLKYYEELDEAGREALLQQIAETDMSILASCMHKEELVQKGKITPLAAMELEEIAANRKGFTAAGLEAIRDGKVGAVLLAGGMAPAWVPTIPSVCTMWASPESCTYLSAWSTI